MSVELEDQVAQRTADLEQANVAKTIKEEEIRSVVEHLVDCVITIDEKGIIRKIFRKPRSKQHTEEILQAWATIKR